MKINIIPYSRFWLSLSVALVAVSLIAVAIFGLKAGIEFTGGTLIEIKTTSPVTSTEMQDFFAKQGYEAVSQQTTPDQVILRTKNMTSAEHQTLVAAVAKEYPGATEISYETIGPVIGQELRKKSVIAVIILLSAIVAYVAWAFRKVSDPVKSWKYGLLAILAAAHDVIIPAGVFAVLGHFWGYEIDAAFIAAILTILGYSINDTIVIFDRIRENLHNESVDSKEEFATLVNTSIRQSFARSLNTSFATLLALIAVLFFGGESTRSFALAMVIGIISGAYSSIFVASPLLVLLFPKKK